MMAHTDATNRNDPSGGRTDGGASGRAGDVTVVTAFGAVWTLAALFLLAGVQGAVVGGVVLLVWLLESGWAAFAVGHAGMLALVPVEAQLLSLAPVEAGLVVLLLGSLVGAASPYRTLAVSLATLAVLALVAFGVATFGGSIIAAGAVLVALGGVFGYLAHRYERLRLGFLGGETA